MNADEPIVIAALAIKLLRSNWTHFQNEISGQKRAKNHVVRIVSERPSWKDFISHRGLSISLQIAKFTEERDTYIHQNGGKTSINIFPC